MIDILAISPHPDDAEISCGGALLVCKNKGYKTGILYMTAGEMGTGGKESIRREEISKAANYLDLDYYNIAHFKDCQITDSFENRLIIANYFRKLKPKIVLLPFWKGVPGRGQGHTDHLTTSLLASHAINFCRLKKMPLNGDAHEIKQVFYYLFPHTIQPTFLIDISSVSNKWKKAIEAHQTQITGEHAQKIRFYQMVLSYHQNMGFYIEAEYAQAFFSAQAIKISDPFAFLEK